MAGQSNDAIIIDMLKSATYDNTPIMTYDFTKAKVIKVYDGDTFWIAAVIENKIYRFSVRLFGCDCSEIKGGTEESKLHAQKAKEFVKNAILNKIIDIEVLNGKKYDGKLITEKYGRLIAKIKYYDNQNNKLDLTEELLKNNLAYAYFGGTKQS